VTADLRSARAAKDRLAAVLADHPLVSGVGVARDERGGHVVKVLLSAPAADVPAEQDGVPVVAEVVGRIARRDGGAL
jgi:hypothetical protein